MPRDSQSVAIELIDLVRQTATNQDHCRKLLAIKLEMIYDYAYAMGYKAGKEFAGESAYDRGFAEGSQFAQAKLVQLTALPQLPAATQNLTDAQQPPTPRARGKRRLLFGLPCDVCGALYIDNQCPVCSVRESADDSRF